MKALRRESRDVGDIRLVDIPVPEPTGKRVLAKVAYAGICGSDLDILYSRNTIYQPPVVQGHEFSAVITEVGGDVRGYQIGDTIVSETTFGSCGTCQMCHNGNYHLCRTKAIVGWTENGGFAEYVLLNSHYLHRLSAQTDLRSAALVEPTAIATEGVHVKGKLQPGETVAVIGPGTIGLLSALVALELGAKNVYLIGLSDAREVRFRIAAELGVSHCIDSGVTDPLTYLLDTNGGGKPDLVVDATGNINGFRLALDLVKRNGRIVEAGSITTDAPFPWEKAAYAAIDLHFVFSSSHQAWAKAVRIFNTSRIDYTKLITAICPLDDYRRAFELAANPSQSLKVLFDPSK
ncbi:MAG: alcohol dehydrogenase catalytic domain-containing protein [Bacteroidetes bacterium]|nr:alcohol dehydrogenase catalytic domain-containing protein [Fibrella sp.]